MIKIEHTRIDPPIELEDKNKKRKNITSRRQSNEHALQLICELTIG
ncbi:hypothetical protein ABEV74_22485 [Paenibacillus cisolokensis]